MSEDPSVNLENNPLEDVAEASPVGQPVIVIQYRNRGVPWGMVIVLLAAAALVAVGLYHRIATRRNLYGAPPIVYQVVRPASADAPPPSAPAVALAANTQPIHPGTPTPAPLPASAPPAASPAPALSGAPSPPSSPTSTAPTTKTATNEPEGATASKPADSSPPPAPPAPVSKAAAPLLAIPLPENGIDPFEAILAERVRSEPGREKRSDLAPAALRGEQVMDDRPFPSPDELLEDIHAEADQKREELNQLRDLKKKASGMLAAEALDRSENERLQFRVELNGILKSNHRKAGQEINDLCDRFGRNYDPNVRDKVASALKVSSGRMPTSSRLNLLRSFGVPEPGLLDYLAREIDRRQLNSRNGPRTPDQVRIMAARQLLMYRLPEKPMAPPTQAPARMNPRPPGNIAR